MSDGEQRNVPKWLVVTIAISELPILFAVNSYVNESLVVLGVTLIAAVVFVGLLVVLASQHR